ncbi:MAG: metal-dependent hydrolase [Anaerolineae bacterium]|nr:metal-dependent hydrolase [Anaerolineae bacterium]
MLIAHLVPGYFVAAKVKQNHVAEWNTAQQTLMWSVALGSSIAPDLDVVRNFLFRGFFNHSTLWTHSIFVYLGFALLWLGCRKSRKLAYSAMLMGIIAVGGLSHLVLDLVAHGTPLFYPVSMIGFGIAPQRVVEGGVWAYLTDPIFLLEPLLIGIAVCHWICHRESVPLKIRKLLSIVVACGILAFALAFVVFLPGLQRAVLPFLPV